MIEFVTINGVAVRVTGLHRPELGDIGLVVVLRGAVAHHWFRSLLEDAPVRFGIPGEPERRMTIAASTWTTSGEEPAVYRHEVTLREPAGDCHGPEVGVTRPGEG